MEQLRVRTSTSLALRGQAIGGFLGTVGLVGSLIIAGLGQGWAGFGIALTSLVSLVSVFVYGRDQQKQERMAKDAVRGKIDKGASIDKLGEFGTHEPTSPTAGSSPGEPEARRSPRRSLSVLGNRDHGQDSGLNRRGQLGPRGHDGGQVWVRYVHFLW